MRHPSEYYIRYLLAADWGDDESEIDLDSVNITLHEYGLPTLSEEAFERLRSIFEAPDNFHFNSPSHKETVVFMRQEQIHTIWSPNEDMSRVLEEMLGDSNRTMQQTVHIMLMGDMPSDVIARLVSKRYRLKESLTEDMVDLYRHYFWRVKNLNEREWEILLADDPHFDRHISSLYCGPQQAMFRAGFNPKYDYKQALRDTHRQVAFRIQYMGFKSDSKRNIDLLIKMSREQRALYNVLYGEGGGFEEQVREVRRFLMEHKIPDVKALDELIGEEGSYSGDGTDEDRQLVAVRTTKKLGARKGPKKGDQDDVDEDA